jgi:hypothetical protein
MGMNGSSLACLVLSLSLVGCVDPADDTAVATQADTGMPSLHICTSRTYDVVTHGYDTIFTIDVKIVS